MKLRNVISKIEDVDEKYRDLYEKGTDSDGADCFYLQTEETTGLKSALDREREKGAKARKVAAAFEEAGITIEAFEAQGRKVADLELVIAEKGADDKTDVEKIRTQVREEMAETARREIETKEGRITVLESALQRRVIRDDARTAIVAAKGNADLLMPHVENSLRMKEVSEGKFSAIVVDDTGEERTGDSYGNPMTISQFVDEMRGKDAFLTAFEGTDKKGANLNPGGGGGRRDYADIKDPVQRLRQFREDNSGKG